jgi:geranylgeranyl pyrophosphate synthase
VKDEFDNFLDRCRGRTNTLLEACLPLTVSKQNLAEAIRYATLSNGKRIRPCLVYAAAETIGEYSEATDHVASAVELIHTYSLIHDDLPSMDDDLLRRGKPACHVAFGEANAILAGDGLQALAFEQLGLIEDLDPNQVLLLIRTLAKAIGPDGMVLGQAMDLIATQKDVDLAYLEAMHKHKTADLITASVEMGVLSTGVTDQETIKALREYGEAIGLAFQVMDDILDADGDIEIIGKHTGSDAHLKKSTYVSLIGIEKSKILLTRLLEQSLQSLDRFDYRADHLRNIAQYVVGRNH